MRRNSNVRLLAVAGGMLAIAACAPARVPPESVSVVAESPQAAETAEAQAPRVGPRIYVDGVLVDGGAASSTGPKIYVDGQLVEPADQ
jgi:hypothetical protein